LWRFFILFSLDGSQKIKRPISFPNIFMGQKRDIWLTSDGEGKWVGFFLLLSTDRWTSPLFPFVVWIDLISFFSNHRTPTHQHTSFFFFWIQYEAPQETQLSTLCICFATCLSLLHLWLQNEGWLRLGPTSVGSDSCCCYTITCLISFVFPILLDGGVGFLLVDKLNRRGKGIYTSEMGGITESDFIRPGKGLAGYNSLQGKGIFFNLEGGKAQTLWFCAYINYYYYLCNRRSPFLLCFLFISLQPPAKTRF